MHDYSVPPREEEKKKREFSALECAVAWLSFIGGYSFCRFFPVSDRPLGGFILILSMFIAASIFMGIKGKRPNAIHVSAAVSAVVISSALILTSNGLICHLAYMYSLLVFCYYLYAVGGNSQESGFSNFIISDMFTALFVSPYLSLCNIFRPMFSRGRSGKIAARIAAGIAIAIIPTAAVFVLLSTNSEFYKLIEKIFTFDLYTVLSHVTSLIFAFPIATYVFGLFVSSSDGKGKDYLLKREEAAEIFEKAKRLSPVSTVSAVAPILFLYVIFFISQLDYYVSGFTGVLPEGFSYANYAREGFFGLCAVSFINFSIIIGVILFMKQDSRASRIMLKSIVLIYSLCTLVLVSTAMAKMLMYIDAYGLTPKRVYVTCAIILLSVIFLITAIRQFVPKRKNATMVCLAVCVVFFGAVAVSDLEGIIARYNTDRYIDGSLDINNASYLYDLGDSAIPELVRLCEEFPGYETEHLANYLECEKADFEAEKSDVFAFNIPHLKAKAALEKFKH